jgi:hypothetical protein
MLPVLNGRKAKAGNGEGLSHNCFPKHTLLSTSEYCP